MSQSQKQKILLLEDDLQLNGTITQFLNYLGYQVFSAYDAVQAKDIVYEQKIDLMLLDVKVPYQNGFSFLKELRHAGDKTPAIFITSLNSVNDVMQGFETGCDDYIRKPFALKELEVRIDGVLKRYFATQSEELALGNGYYFNIKGRYLSREGERIALKTKETNLLALFLQHPNELMHYEQIFESLWGYGEEPSHGSLRAYINTLRQLLGKERFVTVKHAGYRYVSQ